jgi:hypothetical protein
MTDILGPGHDPNDCDVCQEEARQDQRNLGSVLRTLRAQGWMVAAHNDYRLDGQAMTFWLFTHQDGRYVKGRGRH